MTFGVSSLTHGLDANAVSAAPGDARAEAALPLAGIALPAGIALALAVHAHAVLATLMGAMPVLAPLAVPPVVACARAERRVTRAVPVAAVHAIACRAASGGGDTACGLPQGSALARAIEAAAIAVACRLPTWPHGACTVLAVGATPPIGALARTRDRVARAMAAAATRAWHTQLARGPAVVGCAVAHTGCHSATDAAPVAVSRACTPSAASASPAVIAHADVPCRVARAMRTAALCRPTTHPQRCW